MLFVGFKFLPTKEQWEDALGTVKVSSTACVTRQRLNPQAPNICITSEKRHVQVNGIPPESGRPSTPIGTGTSRSDVVGELSKYLASRGLDPDPEDIGNQGAHLLGKASDAAEREPGLSTGERLAPSPWLGDLTSSKRMRLREPAHCPRALASPCRVPRLVRSCPNSTAGAQQ